MGLDRTTDAGTSGLWIYPRSKTKVEGTVYFLGRGPKGKVLVVHGDATGFEGGDGQELPLTPGNAAALRERLPWLRPQPLGLGKSVGCGDRLGLATPGHLRAVRRAADAGQPMAPIPAQQSMRENARTGRTPQQVLDDAMWGVFQEGWREPWGADADHLKTTADVDLCVAAGYTFYTIDPGDHVDNTVDPCPDPGGLGSAVPEATAPLEILEEKVRALPWTQLEDSPQGLYERYLGRRFEVESAGTGSGLILEFDETSLARAAAKYGRAVAHTTRMYRHLSSAMGGRSFELEVSVDETETPTTPLEHYFIASEMKRLGVEWVSLAPRYVGRFEKGADYLGDLDQFEAELAKHAAIARALGPYKLSIHSGSDKFSVYPLFARHAGDLVHLKTAGTSYLEALRAIAGVDPGLFRQILALARERYAEDRLTYHVSADLARVPSPEELADGDLASVLDRLDGREVLHVTFGSVLDRFGEPLQAALIKHEEAYYAALEAHFQRHLDPFAAPGPRSTAGTPGAVRV